MDSNLIHGNGLDYIATLPDNSIDAIITDPPYDMQLDVSKLRRACTGNILLFCKPENQYCHADEYLFWIKTPSTKNYSRHPGRFVEMVLVLRGPTFNVLHWSQMTGVYDDRLINPPTHPYEKPLALIERLVRIYTKPGDTILDPFMGSGTTGIAARNLGREFIGIEQSVEYYNLAKGNIDDSLS